MPVRSASLNLTPARSSRSSSSTSKPAAVRSCGDLFAGFEQGGFLDVGDGDYDLERGDGGGQGVGIRRCSRAALSFDGGGEDALDTDAVAAHDGRYFLAVAVEDGGAHGVGVLVAELEDVPDLDGLAEAQGLAADGVELAFEDVADVGGKGGSEVAAWGDVAEVVVELVGSGDEVLPAFEAEVHDDDGLEALAGVFAETPLSLSSGLPDLRPLSEPAGHDLGDADGAEVAGGAADVQGKFFGEHGTEFGGAGDGVQLGFVDEVVAAQEGHDRAQRSVCGWFGDGAHEGDALDVLRGLDPEERGDVGDRGFAGRVHELGQAVARGGKVFDG